MSARVATPDMLRRLVSFDTTSSKSNIAVIDFIRDYLAGHGIACRLTPSSDGAKSNLYATIGPADVKRVAAEYLTPDRRSVVRLEPQRNPGPARRPVRREAR